ncbi:MAG: RNA polymerase sigma factor [Clostridia bacterium]|nr:RNA polymerase sigma factor [Clostridia bacterium]
MTKEEFARRIIALSPVMYRLAWSQLPQQADREDAVQEAIRRAWEKRDQLRDERRMQTWVIRILLNVCDTQRRRAKRMLLVEDVGELSSDLKPETSLLDALFSLEDKYRLPIHLHYIEGYDVAEVAAILRIPVGTVKSRLARGRDKLRTLLNEEVFEP